MSGAHGEFVMTLRVNALMWLLGDWMCKNPVNYRWEISVFHLVLSDIPFNIIVYTFCRNLQQAAFGLYKIKLTKAQAIPFSPF